MQDLFNDAEYQQNPLQLIKEFLKTENAFETAKQYENMRFVGYVLEIGYEEVKIITSDPYKKAVGGIPRGSLLIMLPQKFNGMPPHFTLLRVKSTAPTPLSNEVQQTYFELHKKSMPELDRWTTSELQWGALSTTVLGMYYPNPKDIEKISFSGDVNNVVSGHKYKVFSPTDKILDLIVNGTLTEKNRFTLGDLRVTECQLPFHNIPQVNVDVNVSTNDFRGFRTAMFGKTRLGKSNVVKLIAQSIIETTQENKSIGQVIFDINGEYANDNPQNTSIRSAFPHRCKVFALTSRPNTPSEPLRLNFYAQPSSGMEILGDYIKSTPFGQSGYLQSFSNVSLSSIEELREMNLGDVRRPRRKILIYWAILKEAGFEEDLTALKNLIPPGGRSVYGLNPGYKKDLREAAYKFAGKDVRQSVDTLYDLIDELKVIDDFRLENPKSDLLKSSSGKPTFEADDIAMLEVLNLKQNRKTGASIIRSRIDYHNPNAGDFIKKILDYIDDGLTVILDLGNASDQIRSYFSDMVSKAVFAHQEKKFTSDSLGDHFVQLYFEEAHNLFPNNSNNNRDIYSRFAKEGAKFHIGMVYSTQSPSTVNKDLLAQTENFFVGHLSSKDEANSLAKLQVAFDGLQKDIMSSRTPGYMRMLTFSHRFVVPVQAKLFDPPKKNTETKQ